MKKIIHLGQWAPNHVVGNHSVYSAEGISPCLNAAGGGGTVPSITEVDMKKLEIVGNITNYSKQNGRVFSEEPVAPTIDISGVKGRATMITVSMNGEEFHLKKENKAIRETIQNNSFIEGEVKAMDSFNRSTSEDVVHTLKNGNHNDRAVYDGLRIRRLTPKECWRLMGFSDEDFEKARVVNSDTQLYKQAGNSIVVDVLVAILKNLLTSDGDEEKTQGELW